MLNIVNEMKRMTLFNTFTPDFFDQLNTIISDIPTSVMAGRFRSYHKNQIQFMMKHT